MPNCRTCNGVYRNCDHDAGSWKERFCCEECSNVYESRIPDEVVPTCPRCQEYLVRDVLFQNSLHTVMGSFMCSCGWALGSNSFRK